jgi:hypothetical protein
MPTFQHEDGGFCTTDLEDSPPSRRDDVQYSTSGYKAIIGGGNSPSEIEYGRTGSFGGGDANSQIFVPLETSIVVITDSDGNRFWQRPIAGMVFFRTVEWPRGSGGPAVDAYNAVGEKIGHWGAGYRNP